MRYVLLWGACGVVVLGGLLGAWSRCNSAKRASDGELARLDAVREKAAAIRTLRRGAEDRPTPAGTGDGLATRVPDVLRVAGIPGTALQSLTPQSEPYSPEAGLRMSRQRAVVSLAPITLPQLGAFLSAWRAAEPRWVISRVDVAPEASAAAEPGADLPLRAGVIVETLKEELSRGAP